MKHGTTHLGTKKIQGYERANLVTHEQVELIKAIDKRSPEQVQSAVKAKGTTYASLILHLLQNLSRSDTVQYVCILADSILSGLIFSFCFCFCFSYSRLLLLHLYIIDLS